MTRHYTQEVVDTTFGATSHSLLVGHSNRLQLAVGASRTVPALLATSYIQLVVASFVG